MWWKLAQQKKKTNFKPIGLEEAIMRGDAEKCIRQHLFYKGEYAPEQSVVDSYVKRVIRAIQQDHPNLNTVRTTIEGEQLLPKIDAAAAKLINAVMRKKKK